MGGLLDRAGDEDFVEAQPLPFSNFGAKEASGGDQRTGAAGIEARPLSTTSLPPEGAIDRGGRFPSLLEAKDDSGVGFLDAIEGVAEEDLAIANHRDFVGDHFDLAEEVGGEEDGSVIVGDGADDRGEDFSSYDGIEAGGWLVEEEQFRPVGEGGHEADSSALSFGEFADLGSAVDGEGRS